jgi:hypothetical protein
MRHHRTEIGGENTMSNETQQQEKAAIIAEKDAQIAQLETALEVAMGELDKLPSRVGQPVPPQYGFQTGKEVYISD